MFTAYDFIYDGVPSNEYGLMLGSIGSSSFSDESPLGAELDIHEDIVPTRVQSIFYGVSESLLEFDLSFVSCKPFSRFELEQIASSLAGKQKYCPLYICQPDLEDVYFMCILNDFQVTYIGGQPIGLSCTAHCDSPFAYTAPRVYIGKCPSAQVILNESSYNGFIYPSVKIVLPAGSTGISVINHSDSDRVFEVKITQAMGTDVVFEIDENQVVKCETSGVPNPYECITDFRFLRLVKGRNDLELTGQGTIEVAFKCLKRVGG